MNKMQKAALVYMREHWHTGMVGSSATASVLGMNPSTLKTRIARNQARVMRTQGGETIKPLMVTGFQLVFNLLQDRLMRYGFSWDSEGKAEHQVYAHADWILRNILDGEYKVDTILIMSRDSDGRETLQLCKDGDAIEYTGDAALIIPIGTMTVRLALSMLMRSENAELLQQLTSSD